MFHHFLFFFFFFNDPATTEIYTLSLHDALPIFREGSRAVPDRRQVVERVDGPAERPLGLIRIDRKSTRLNSSHTVISYAVFCLKKKKKNKKKTKKKKKRKRRKYQSQYNQNDIM